MNDKMTLLRFAFAMLLMAFMLAARGELTVEIIGGAGKQFPIAIVPFAQEPAGEGGITPIVAADLARSGAFRVLDIGGMVPLPSEPSQINYPDFRNRAADAIVIGSVRTLEGGQIEARFRLMDAVRQTQITGNTLTAPAAQSRALAHRIADLIYEAMTGDKGIFSTRVAYIVKAGKRTDVKVADADGLGERTIWSSDDPIISLAWSPDGASLAYVILDSNQRSRVVIQNVATGQRRTIAAASGYYSAPAFSPDGKRLAVAHYRGGNFSISLLSVDGGGAETLTNSPGIDTEPVFSPDGKWVAFTSDRSGSPQIYRVPVGGGEAQRLTFSGSYAVSPDWSPDGKSLTYLQREGGKFRVAILDLESGQAQVLTDTSDDERPRFAPNSKFIVYATKSGGRGVLATVSADGRTKVRLSTQAGNVREPAWGPLPRQ